MQAHTFTIELPVSKRRAFHYIADLSNLPQWAPAFAQKLITTDNALKAVTPYGEMFPRVNADGVIDMYANPTEDGTDFLGTRVLTAPDGHTRYTVTFFRDAGLSDAEFTQHCTSTHQDTNNIRRCLS